MPDLNKTLDLERCPHCSVARPNLSAEHQIETVDSSGQLERKWLVYVCASCGNLVTAWSFNWRGPVIEYFPSARTIDELLPDKPREFLRQASESMHAPAGAIMLAASAVDSMLKLKGYKQGSLYARIEQAAKDHLITKEMAEWAHEVRLDANDQRHADDDAALPLEHDAQRVFDFTTALAQFLFVLPAKIQRGLEDKTD
jgi:hypothetical protein